MTSKRVKIGHNAFKIPLEPSRGKGFTHFSAF